MADTYPVKNKEDTDQFYPGYGREEPNPIAKRPKSTFFGRRLASEATETPTEDRRAGGYTRQGAINRKRQMDEAFE